MIVQKWRKYGFLTEADQRRLMIALQRMRMSCDSSYLVDHMTDHGTKADEAVTQIDELLERRGTKIVVFSQWRRMLCLAHWATRHQLEREDVSQAAAVEAAQGALRQANLRYQGGIVTYLEVVTTENAALAAQLAAVDIQVRRVNATVLLVKALGGDWRQTPQ